VGLIFQVPSNETELFNLMRVVGRMHQMGASADAGAVFWLACQRNETIKQWYLRYYRSRLVEPAIDTTFFWLIEGQPELEPLLWLT
jgi:hypothetical protein